MPFAFYARLTRAQQRVYRRSDEVSTVPLPGAAALRPHVEAMARALEAEDRAKGEAAAQALLDSLTRVLRVPPVRVEVLAARPSRDWGELHGLYSPGERGARPRITVWMRTAQRRQVVAFRTFLRTLIHELCHHLDYELLRLPDSFHTEGFYRRESSLVHHLLGALAPNVPGSARGRAGERPRTPIDPGATPRSATLSPPVGGGGGAPEAAPDSQTKEDRGGQDLA